MKYKAKTLSATFTLVWICAWIGYALTAVHRPVKTYPQGETYGWEVPMGIAGMLIPLAFMAFHWGKDSAKDE